MASVSLSTVSNALTDRRHVDEKTRARVREAAQMLGYIPNIRAQGLRAGRADTIGLFQSQPLSVGAGPTRMGYSLEIAAVAAYEAAARGMALMLVPPLADRLDRLASFYVDGAIVIEPNLADRTTAELLARGVRVVTIGQHPGLAVPHVDLRSLESIQILLEHLWAQGSRRIALIGSTQKHDLQLQSERAYAVFARIHDMTPCSVGLDESGGQEAARDLFLRLLRERPEIDAFCIPYDPFVLGALDAMDGLGIPAPARPRIVTRYNSIRMQAAEITALDLQLSAIGMMGVDLLLSQLAGEPSETRIGPLPTLLVRRSSTGPATGR